MQCLLKLVTKFEDGGTDRQVQIGESNFAHNSPTALSAPYTLLASWCRPMCNNGLTREGGGKAHKEVFLLLPTPTSPPDLEGEEEEEGGGEGRRNMGRGEVMIGRIDRLQNPNLMDAWLHYGPGRGGVEEVREQGKECDLNIINMPDKKLK